MATTLLLIRHAAHDRVNSVLCGRMTGVHLGDHGRRQAACLARWLAPRTLAAIYSSPLARAVETALALTPEPAISERLTELDYGDWTGQTFSDLAGDPRWAIWNTARAGTRPPGGESIAELQARIHVEFRHLQQEHDGSTIALVSHAEIIKTMVAALLPLSPDHYKNFDIAPASVSIIVVWPGGGKVISLNESSFQERDAE